MNCSSSQTRIPAVAGSFYTDDAAALSAQILELLQAVPEGTHPVPRGLIAPHAGYIYSGATAARAYKRLQPLKHKIKRVALLGPAHRVYLEGMALPRVDAFATPLGEIPLDQAGLQKIAKLPGISHSDEAHREEHSLEVHLPFLQTLLPDFSLVPIVVGRCKPQWVASVIDQLWEDPSTLLLVSTDLSHFHSYEEACRIDQRTCQRVLSRASDLDGGEACGAHVLNGLMQAKTFQSLQIELVHRCNSGDTAGDHRRVVGYGAFSLH